MKKYIVFALSAGLLLQLISCHPAITPEYSLEPTGMTLKVVDGTLSTSGVKVTIDLDEDEHYYYCGIVKESEYLGRKDDASFMQAVMDTLYNDYLEWAEIQTEFKESVYGRNRVWKVAPFASHCLKYGNDNLTFTELESDTRYVVYCFCVTPDNHSPLGDLYSLEVATKPWVPSDISFKVTFQEKSDGPFITVNPSNDNDSYIWDFAEASYVQEYYKGNVTEFLIDEISLYQDLGWLSDLVKKSISSRNVSGWMYQPDTFIFMVGGYDGGFTTPIFTDTVLYPFQIDSLSFQQ